MTTHSEGNVVNNKEIQDQPKSLESFARGLLATTCLTVACGASAVAGTITEGTTPAPTDFPNSANGYVLPVGTNMVIGGVGAGFGPEGGFDPADWFEFTGLTGGASYALSACQYNTECVMNGTLGAENGLRMDIFDDTMTMTTLGSQVTLETLGGNDQPATFNSPGDGNVVVELLATHTPNFGVEGSIEAGGGGNYKVSLTQNDTSAPEPSTLGGAALGLTGIALAWRRRRKD